MFGSTGWTGWLEGLTLGCGAFCVQWGSAHELVVKEHSSCCQKFLWKELGGVSPVERSPSRSETGQVTVVTVQWGSPVGLHCICQGERNWMFLNFRTINLVLSRGFFVYTHMATTFLLQPLQSLFILESQNSTISRQPRPMTSRLQNKLSGQFSPKSELSTQTQPKQPLIFRELLSILCRKPSVRCHQAIKCGTTWRALHEDEL